MGYVYPIQHAFIVQAIGQFATDLCRKRPSISDLHSRCKSVINGMIGRELTQSAFLVDLDRYEQGTQSIKNRQYCP